MTFRARYFLFGGVAIVAAVGLISWHFFGGRGEVLKPDGGQVLAVMDFGQSFPLDPLPSGWRHRKFRTRSPMSMSFTVKDGVPSMRFESDDGASMLFRHVDIDLAAYPMLAWRWYIELPIRSPLDERSREGDDHPARLFLRFATDHGEKPNRRAPRASRSALTSDGAARAGGACLPTGASRGGTQPRFLNSCVQPGSWFFPRSARSSEPQLGVGEAGTAMSRARSTR